MTEKLLLDYFNALDFDVRKTRDGTWIDQKCTPDEVRFVAECILAYIDGTGETEFLSPDVWHSEFARQQVQIYFGKPDPSARETLDEYNKFFRQPMKMFAFAGVLNTKGKIGNAINFSVANRDVLSFIARNDWNAYIFLTHYVEKVLRDSGIWDPFATFFERQDMDSFNWMRERFIKFQLRFTPKNTDVEIRRILPKVLNPLSCRLSKKGIIKGRMSKFKISFPVLQYNQENWRDAGKPKEMSRREFSHGMVCRTAATEYLVSKAKKEVRNFNDSFCSGMSEVMGPHHGGRATHMHHMFMASEFPVLAEFPENIIALTPGQHLGLAHPSGATDKIDPDYQYQCLLSKSQTIERNVSGHCGPLGVYDFAKFVFVLGTGLKTSVFDGIPTNDFTELRHCIDAICG